MKNSPAHPSRGFWMAMAIVGISLFASESRAQSPGGKLTIGVVETVFRDVPSSFVQFISRPLKMLLEQHTGMKGEIVLVKDYTELSRKMKSGQIQLGVMSGVELAWARVHNPNMKPVVLAVRKKLHLHSSLVVSANSNVRTCGDLKGKSIGLPRRSRMHCHVYLDRRCPNAATDPKSFFSTIDHPSSGSKGLDAVVRGKLDALVIDNVDLERYARSKSGSFRKLRVLHKSESFPTGVLVYQEGQMAPGKVSRLRTGLRSAGKSAKGKQMLKMCQTSAFEAVPSDFLHQLQTIAKAYPPKSVK